MYRHEIDGLDGASCDNRIMTTTIVRDAHRLHGQQYGERPGGQTKDTLGIENYVSVLETNGRKFVAELEDVFIQVGLVPNT
jgi:alkyl hydroperoxide reductase subunit AhpF